MLKSGIPMNIWGFCFADDQLLSFHFDGYTFFHVALSNNFFWDDDAFAVTDVSEFYCNHVKTKLQQKRVQISVMDFQKPWRKRQY